MIVKRTSPSVLIFINLQKSCFGQHAVHACSAIVELLFSGVKDIARKLKTSLMIVNMRYKTCLIGYKTSMEMKLREASFSVKLFRIKYQQYFADNPTSVKRNLNTLVELPVKYWIYFILNKYFYRK